MNIVLLSEIFPPVHGGSGRWFYELYKRISDIKLWIVTNRDVSRDLPGFPHKVERDLPTVLNGVLSVYEGYVFIRDIKFVILAFVVANNITQESFPPKHGRVLHEGLIGAIVSRFPDLSLLCLFMVKT